MPVNKAKLRLASNSLLLKYSIFFLLLATDYFSNFVMPTISLFVQTLLF